jgi:hypothetical protein
MAVLAHNARVVGRGGGMNRQEMEFLEGWFNDILNALEELPERLIKAEREESDKRMELLLNPPRPIGISPEEFAKEKKAP